MWIPRLVPRGLGLISAGLLLTACAAYGGAQVLPVDVLSQPMRGFRFSSIDTLEAGEGMRLHGSICRDRPNLTTPTGVRWERHNAAGQILATNLIPLSGGRISGRHGGCTTFDATLTWRPAPGERVLVCAVRGQATCAEQSW